MTKNQIQEAHRASQDFTRWAAFAIEVPDRRPRMLDAARELREALDRLIEETPK